MSRRANRPASRTAPRRRRHASATATADARGHGGSELATLFDLGGYHRNELSLTQINRVRDLIDTRGLQRAAEAVGVSEMTALRVAAGFGHRLRPDTAAKVRKYFGG